MYSYYFDLLTEDLLFKVMVTMVVVMILTGLLACVVPDRPAIHRALKWTFGVEIVLFCLTFLLFLWTL